MAYVYICDKCKVADHANCEIDTRQGSLPSDDASQSELFSYGFCVCACEKGTYLDVPAFQTTSEAFEYRNERSRQEDVQEETDE